MNLFSRQSQSKRTATAWLLIGVFMLQPVITFFASPAFMNDSDGRMVVVCTLYGLEEIYVEDGMLISEAESDYCPAVELMQISGSAYQPKPPMVAATLTPFTPLLCIPHARPATCLIFLLKQKNRQLILRNSGLFDN
ncbi:hypothetical protein [Solemya velum gill symbiont]|uniref:hypothetical protein n=1 Tax=Solemya velum gill symbiont TaxID=2340 RepID=UPI000998C10F|nr:hypothetical protein [Solemya velum gill symbiont]OOZ13614.1 hypothetical protein BOW25_04155 [Solemya velum gill symbiont]